MAPLSFSPTNSISSHTLSAQSAQPPPMELQNSHTQDFTSSLSATPYAFLQPPKDLHTAALALAKQFLDPLASDVSDAQIQRQKENRKKRKRGEGDDGETKVLQLKKVHLDGFGINQIWEQARRVLDAACLEVEQAIPQAQNGRIGDARRLQSEDMEDESIWSDEDEIEMSGSESLGEEGIDWEYDDVDRAEGEEALDEHEGLDDGVEESESPGQEIDEEQDDFDDSDNMLEDQAGTFVPDPNGLNDGFFSIDDFNKQSDFLEQQDARGEPPASDDEELDWDANPFTTASGKSNMNGHSEEDDDEDDEEGGPTFGNVNLNAPEGESEEDEPLEDGEMDDIGGVSNANNLMYADFFAPPARKVGKNKKKRGRPNPHNFPSASDLPNTKQGIGEDDIERTMSAVHRDLFEDSDDDESEGALSDLDPSDPKSRRSTHERRQAKLAEEIRRLEAANVAKREWTLSGEARAADRPLNSLLEQDLEFERSGKPVPLITAEVSEEIEALIKRRILAGEFDELRRRRPDDLATGLRVRRGQFELDDTKSGKGLAEIYEEEHLRQTDPHYVDAKDEKTRKEHAEIEALWKNVSRKLDSLSSWHYKPKPAAPSLEVRVDAPAMEMEDARPTAGGEVAGESMLAPQEVYKPGDQRNKEEIVTKGGVPIAREEMSREQKLRRRRREKERIKKAGLNETSNADNGNKKTQQNKQMIGDLKKGGVRVIGKKGEVTDVEGQKLREKARVGGGNFKL